MIDPVWNETVNNNASYYDVLVDVYAPESVRLSQVSDEQGMQTLAKALKHAAMTVSPADNHQTYLEDNEDYGTDVIRVSDVESIDCWYGYIYTQNKSKYRLKETLRPQLEGLEVAYPAMSPDAEDFELDIAPGDDHIIVLRRIENSCKYGLQYLTHERELTDEEMVEACKEMDDMIPFGESAAYYKLFYTNLGVVFYFDN